MEEAGRIKADGNYLRMSEGFRKVAEGEKRLRIFYNRHVVAAEMRDREHLASVTAVDTLTGRRCRLGRFARPFNHVWNGAVRHGVIFWVVVHGTRL